MKRIGTPSLHFILRSFLATGILFLVGAPVVSQTTEGFDDARSILQKPPSSLMPYNEGWRVEDEAAIPWGVAINDFNVWGAWNENAERLSAYPIEGDGTPDFEFFPFEGSRALINGSVSVSKGADRVVYFAEALGEGFRLHAFSSQSAGTPDWSFEFPVGDNLLNAGAPAISHDGSTAAALSPDTLYVFDAETGEVTFTRTDTLITTSTALTDDGSIVLIGQTAPQPGPPGSRFEPPIITVFATDTGEILFQAETSADYAPHQISGDGEVLAVGGNDRVDVYQFDGDTYQLAFDITPPEGHTIPVYILSRDGSTVGTFAFDTTTFTDGEVTLFDVPSGEALGSYQVSGSGDLPAAPFNAASSDNGSVVAFASWGTENEDWPEILIFDRNVDLLEAIEFPGSAVQVDVSADGQYIAAGVKATHPMIPGSGGSIELFELKPVSNEPSPGGTRNVLSRPSPNPTSETTTLTLTLEHGQHVTVDVFDVTGRRVQALFEGTLLERERKRLTLNTSTLPAGVYVVRVAGEDVAETRNVTVIR